MSFTRITRPWSIVCEYVAWCLIWGAIAPVGEVAARQFENEVVFATGKLIAFPLFMHRLLMPVLADIAPASVPLTEAARSIYDGADSVHFFLLPLIFQLWWLALPMHLAAALYLHLWPKLKSRIGVGRSNQAELDTARRLGSERIWPAFAIGTGFSSLLLMLACLKLALVMAFLIGLGNALADPPGYNDPAHNPDADLESSTIENLTLPDIFGFALLWSVMFGAPFLGLPILLLVSRRILMGRWRRRRN